MVVGSVSRSFSSLHYSPNTAAFSVDLMMAKKISGGFILGVETGIRI